MSLRPLRDQVLMRAIRYAPLPWEVKRRLIALATARTTVAALALFPDAEGRILMLKARYSGRWILPGGLVEPGEDPLSAVRRECHEEIGATLTDSWLVGLYARQRQRELLVVYQGAPLAGPPRLSAEHEAYAYRARAELPEWMAAVAADLDSGGPFPVSRSI